MGIILGMSIFLAESLAPAFNMAEGEHMNFWLLEEQKFHSPRQGSFNGIKNWMRSRTEGFESR